MTYTVLRIVTYVLGIVGSALLIPLAAAIWEGERAMVPVFAVPLALAWTASAAFLIKARGKPRVLGVHDAFGVVGLLWVAVCLFGAVPLYFSGAFDSLSDALFESVSGFTATGATVLERVLKLAPAGGEDEAHGNANVYPRLTLADGKLFVGNDVGQTFVLEATREYKEIARNQLPQGSGSTLTLAGSSLFIRDGESLYCIER
jgi:hypothetical protein